MAVLGRRRRHRSGAPAQAERNLRRTWVESRPVPRHVPVLPPARLSTTSGIDRTQPHDPIEILLVEDNPQRRRTLSTRPAQPGILQPCDRRHRPAPTPPSLASDAARVEALSRTQLILFDLPARRQGFDLLEALKPRASSATSMVPTSSQTETDVVRATTCTPPATSPDHSTPPTSPAPSSRRAPTGTARAPPISLTGEHGWNHRAVAHVHVAEDCPGDPEWAYMLLRNTLSLSPPDAATDSRHHASVVVPTR